MTDPALTKRPLKDGDPDVELNRLLDTGRHMLDEEFKIADRIDQKGRGQVAAAGAFFAVVQTAAGAVLSSADIARGWTFALAGLAILSVGATSMALLRTGFAARLVTDRALPLDKLKGNYLPNAAAGNPLVGEFLVEYTFGLVDERRTVNDTRAAAFKTASGWCLAAVGCSALELMLALVIRITIAT